MSLTLGIDPGLSGALAALDATGEVRRVIDLPVIRDRSLSWIDGSALQTEVLDLLDGLSARVVVERVSAMPKQGVSSMFTFGLAMGSLLGVLQALHLPIEFVTPVTWKRALGLPSDKKAALDKARLLFPYAEINLAKHVGRAEALLIAHWAQRYSLPNNAAA